MRRILTLALAQLALTCGALAWHGPAHAQTRELATKGVLLDRVAAVVNDGVVLNIAPLWELVPWKEAKSYWEELLEGKYEWSSIGKQLREKELVK